MWLGKFGAVVLKLSSVTHLQFFVTTFVNLMRKFEAILYWQLHKLCSYYYLFYNIFSDHHMTAEWSNTTVWETGLERLTPIQVQIQNTADIFASKEWMYLIWCTMQWMCKGINLWNLTRNTIHLIWISENKYKNKCIYSSIIIPIVSMILFRERLRIHWPF